MTRDQALAIADRIMARVTIDSAVHRDAIADEIIAATAVLQAQPELKPGCFDWDGDPPATITPGTYTHFWGSNGIFRWNGDKWVKVPD